MAWVSATTTCPKLQWAGPCVSGVLKTIEEITTHEVVSGHVDGIDEDMGIDEQIQRLILEKENQFFNTMERDRHARATAQYFKLLAGWDASKILQNKPRLLKEVERMRGKKGYV
jgi:hypothetical protein